MSKQTAILNHYTKLETLFKIIKADGLHFFATRYDFLNDKSEHNWSYKPLKEEYKRVGFCADKDFDRFYERFPYVISFYIKNNKQHEKINSSLFFAVGVFCM